jgi:hypothetical protein
MDLDSLLHPPRATLAEAVAALSSRQTAVLALLTSSAKNDPSSEETTCRV